MEGKLPIRAQLVLEKINARGGKAESIRDLSRLFPDWSLPTISETVKMLNSISLVVLEEKKTGRNFTKLSTSITEEGKAYVRAQKQADGLIKVKGR